MTAKKAASQTTAKKVKAKPATANTFKETLDDAAEFSHLPETEYVEEPGVYKLYLATGNVSLFAFPLPNERTLLFTKDKMVIVDNAQIVKEGQRYKLR